MAFQPMPLSPKLCVSTGPQFRDLLFHRGEPCFYAFDATPITWSDTVHRCICEMDLEGIVAKHSLAPYTTERTTWIKIKNRNYSQMQGREELFQRERHKEPIDGWHSCDLACAEAELNA